MKLLTILIICIIGLQVQAQTTAKDQLYEIHKHLRNVLSSDGVNYGVYGTTKKSAIRNFNFKDPDGIDTSASNVWKKTEWKQFLSSIDTATVSNYSLSTGTKPWFKTTGKAKHTLVFAPIMMSADGHLAISILELRDKMGATSLVYFLEKENGQWKVKQNRVIALIDYA